MQYVAYGALGVLFALGLLALGFFAGWRGRGMWLKHTAQAVKQEISEQERREFEAQQKAFDGLLSYNAEQAFGMNKSLEELVQEGGEG